MISSLLVAVFAASSVAVDQFYMSYMPDETDGSYDPLFIECGTSCSDCQTEAVTCHAADFSNLCYEPDLGETCCGDAYGTSCYDGYYCAYDTENIGFCCVTGEDEEDCAKALNVTLQSTEPQDATSTATATASITAVFTPAAAPTASGATVAVARPQRTQISLAVGTSKHEDDPEYIEKKKDISLTVKIGAALGGVVGLAVLVTLVVMWVMHRKKVAQYAKLGDNKGKAVMQGAPPHHPHQESHSMHVMPPMMPGAHTAYEPMRTQPHHNPSSLGGAPAAHPPAYSDHSPANVGLPHMPPPASSDLYGQHQPRY